MAVAAFLNSSYRYLQRSGISDVQTIWDDFEAECLANSPPWTRTGGAGGLLTSPVDAHGRFLDIQLSRTSQQKLQMVVRDQNNVTVATRRINLPSTNTWIARIFTGQYHAIIDAEAASAAPEFIGAGILDCSPELQTVSTHYVWAAGSRNNADLLGDNTINIAAMVDNITVSLTARSGLFGDVLSGATVALTTINGFRIYRPVEMHVSPTGTATRRYGGRAYQILRAADDKTLGAIYTVPIDTGTTGQFRLIGGWLAIQGQRNLARCG